MPNKRLSNAETDEIKLRQITIKYNINKNVASVEIDKMTEDKIHTKINEKRNNDLAGNKTELGSCNISNCIDSDSVIDENESNDIRV